VIALIISREDPASLNIRDRLLELVSWEPAGDAEGLPVRRYMDMVMAEIATSHLETDHVDRLVAAAVKQVPEAVIVASRHRAQSGSQSLTAHPIGNYGAADFGGKAETLVPVPARLLTQALRFLQEEAVTRRLPHAVAFEATHHGPYLETPTLYLEIGTSEADWADPANGRALAATLIRLAECPEEYEGPVLVAVGGSHYAPKAADLVRKKACAIGHIIPAYHLQAPGGLKPHLVQQAVQKTRPRPEGYFLDDRGLKGEEKPVIAALEAMGLKRYGEKDLKDRTD